MHTFKRIFCTLAAVAILLSTAGCTLRKRSDKAGKTDEPEQTEAALVPVTDLPEFSKNFTAVLDNTKTDSKAVNTFMGTLLAAYNTYDPEEFCKFANDYYLENSAFLIAIKDDASAAADKAQYKQTPEGTVLALSLRQGSMDVLNAQAAFASWRVSYTGYLSGQEPDHTYESLKADILYVINRFGRAFYGQDLLN